MAEHLQDSMGLKVAIADFDLWPTFHFPCAEFVCKVGFQNRFIKSISVNIPDELRFFENLVKEYKVNLLILKFTDSDKWFVGEEYSNVLSVIKPKVPTSYTLVARVW